MSAKKYSCFLQFFVFHRFFGATDKKSFEKKVLFFGEFFFKPAPFGLNLSWKSILLISLLAPKKKLVLLNS